MVTDWAVNWYSWAIPEWDWEENSETTKVLLRQSHSVWSGHAFHGSTDSHTQAAVSAPSPCHTTWQYSCKDSYNTYMYWLLKLQKYSSAIFWRDYSTQSHRKGNKNVYQWCWGGGQDGQSWSHYGADHQRLIDSVESESSVALLVHIREVTMWSQIWDQALDWGPRAVEDIKSLLRLLCTPLFTDRKCPSCAEYIPLNLTFYKHVSQKCDINVYVSNLFTSALEDMESFMISCTNILRSSRTMHMGNDSWTVLHYFISILTSTLSIFNPFLYLYAVSLWAWQWTFELFWISF